MATITFNIPLTDEDKKLLETIYGITGCSGSCGKCQTTMGDIESQSTDGFQNPTPSEPAPTLTETGEIELDVNGFPWDERIHASTKTKNADGSWKKRRGVAGSDYAEVIVELEGKGFGKAAPAPTPAAPAPTPAAPAPTPAAPAPTPAAPAPTPAAPAPTPAAPAPTPAAPAPTPAAPAPTPAAPAPTPAAPAPTPAAPAEPVYVHNDPEVTEQAYIDAGWNHEQLVANGKGHMEVPTPQAPVVSMVELSAKINLLKAENKIDNVKVDALAVEVGATCFNDILNPANADKLPAMMQKLNELG